MEKSITQVTTELFELLEPLASAERQRSLTAALALLGEEFTASGSMANCRDGLNPSAPLRSNTGLEENAERWMVQNQVSRECLDQVFHINNGNAEIIVADVSGKTRKEKTVNCYLLAGIRSLLSSDNSRFGDKEALEICHLADAYDKSNHTTNRKSLGNRMSGERSTGFTLTVPGLRDAAKLIKEMTANE